jgi:hypothetical protein
MRPLNDLAPVDRRPLEIIDITLSAFMKKAMLADGRYNDCDDPASRASFENMALVKAPKP